MNNEITRDTEAKSSFVAPATMAEAEKMKADLGRQILEIGKKLARIKEKVKKFEINRAAGEAQRQPLLEELLVAHRGLAAVKAFILEYGESHPDMILQVSPRLKDAHGGSLAGRKFTLPKSAADAVSRRSELTLEIKEIDAQMSAFKARFPEGRQVPAEEAGWKRRALHAKGVKEAEVGALGAWIRERRRNLEIISLGDFDSSDPRHLLKKMADIIQRRIPWEQLTETDRAVVRVTGEYLANS